MAISGLGCRVFLVFNIAVNCIFTDEQNVNKIAGGSGADTARVSQKNRTLINNIDPSNVKVGFIYNTTLPRYFTNETSSWKRLSGQSGSWNEGKRDAGSENKHEFSDSPLKKSARKRENASERIKRKKDVFKTKSRSSEGGKALSPHDERAWSDGKVTKFIGDNRERKGIESVSKTCNRKQCEKCGRCNESNQTEVEVDLIGGQRGKRDINLGDSSNEDKISDRVLVPNGITVIHPGRGGIVPVFAPELQQERFSSQDEMSNENRKQDMFMSFHPIVFQPVFPTKVEMRPQMHQHRPLLHHQRPSFNQHEPVRFRFPQHQQAFRTPHLVNNGNVQMINTHRPQIVHEFRSRPQHHNFFSGLHFNRFNRSNTAVNNNNNNNNNNQFVSRPWGFEERPVRPNHQLENLDIGPGSVVFEPPPDQHFQRPSQSQRPQTNEGQSGWNAFMQLIQKNPKRPRFPTTVDGPVQNFNRFSHTTQSPRHMFKNGQQIITRLPIHNANANFEPEVTTNAHVRHITTPRSQNQHQMDIEDFFIPTTDTSVIPFDFPSRFTEHNGQLDNQKFNHHSSPRPNHFRPQEQDNRPVHHHQIEHNRNIRPIEDNRNFRPQEDNRNFRPQEDNRNIRPIEDNRNIRPIEDNRNFRPQEDNRNFRPQEDNRNIRPIEDNRNFRPIEIDNFRPNGHQNNENSFRPTDKPKLTTPQKPKHMHKPVPLETPITQRPIPRPTLTRPAHITNRPSLTTPTHRTTNNDHSQFTHSTPHTTHNDHSQFTHSTSHTTHKDHSQFTHSFVPSTTPNSVHFNDEDSTEGPERVVIPSFIDNFHDGFTKKPDPAIIPPRPPFLPKNHSPMYFIPPLKRNMTSPRPEFTTPSSEHFNLKTSHATDFAFRNTFTNQQTSLELTTSRDLEHSTASQIPSHHHSDHQFDDFTKPELTEETTWQSRPIEFNPQTTTQIPPTTFSRHQILRKPSNNGGLPVNKFLTPFVKFREPEVTSQKSFVPSSAVRVTPKAVATPEFGPSLKPASQGHFTVSTTEHNFRDDGTIGEEFDSLMTPVRPESIGSTEFMRTTSQLPPSTFFEDPSQGIEDDDAFREDEDANFNTETENSISWHPTTFTTPFRPETNAITTTGPTTQFHPIKGSGLRFPVHISTSTRRPSIPASTFRPTTFRPPLNVDQFTQFDHGSFPESDISTPLVGSAALPCNADVCRLPNCFCGSNTLIPGDLSANEVPQLVLLTFDDDVNEVNWNVYKKILYTGRQNPNGCPVQATFYVSHEWTDYSKVNTLYLDGHEIASHSISHPDGASYTKQQWKDEIQGQREILSFMGGVPIQQIQGMRAPFLAVGGNKMFGMLYESNFTYDSSLPVPIHDPPLWPYTLDYALGHDCMIPPCPRKSFPGVWEIPMIMWVDLKGGRCSMADACSWPDTKEKVFEQLVKNFQRHYKSNRAPFNLFFHSAWFDKPQNMDGFLLFMDRILTLSDVFFVTSMQAIEWVRQPTPLREIHSFVPFSCHLRSSRGPKCKKPKQCQLRFRSETRYVQSCQECPAVFPWIKNPFGKHL
uniref:NodB homology domain-containing protein n=1 Tax=Strigamia maritima TaxID=126957 RepID=T1JDN2_STRMM